MKLELRGYRPTDLEAVLRLFTDTVHTVCAGDYTAAQLDAWAPEAPDRKAWNDALLANGALVALEDGRMAGFADMTAEGYLDRLYVHREFQRRGVATVLCDTLERGCGAAVLTTCASLTARPFFEGRGWRAVRRQTVERRSVALPNFVMELRR